jgi:hypothetical protein
MSVGNSPNWNPIPDSQSPELNAGPISQPTRFRAVVQASDCPAVVSPSWSVGLIEPVQVGQLTGATTGCGNTLNARLELIGFSGTIIRWEKQTEGSTAWTTINHTLSVLQVTTLPATTRFRVVVGRGSCTTSASVPVTLTVIPPSVGGQVSADATICRGQSSPTLRLLGHFGRVLDWHFSKDHGNTWIAMRKPNLMELESGRLTVETWFRAEVQAGNCPVAVSQPARISVREPQEAGWIAGDTAICEQNSGVQLRLENFRGSIGAWQASFDGNNWFGVPASGATLQTGAIARTTWYRALMTFNGCSADTTPPHQIAVQALSRGGTLLEDRSICSGGTSGQLQLQGQRGSVRFWEVSENQGVSWTSLAYTGQGYESDPLYRNTWFRAAIQHGGCPIVRSSIARITLVNALAGGRIEGGPAFCSNADSLLLSLVSSSGSVSRWEFSTDEGATWIPIINPFTRYVVRQLGQPTRFRALVQSGSCSAVYSIGTRIEPRPAPKLAAKGAVGCEGWGSIEAQASGGTGGYLFSLDLSAKPANSHGRFALLEPVRWLVRVQDAAGCTDTQAIDLASLKPLPEIEHVLNISTNSASVVWRAVPGTLVRYRVTYQVAGQPMNTRVILDNLASPFVTLNGLQHDTPYEVRVEANCGGRILEATAPAFFRTLPAGDCRSTPPPYPGGLALNRITPNTAVFRWSPIRNLSTSQGYIVSFGRQEINPQNWPQFAVCAPDSQFLISGLTPSTAYSIRIRTNCTNCTTALQSSDRRSAWSPAIHFQTLASKSTSTDLASDKQDFKVYPNPCRNEFQIEVSSPGTLHLIDLWGRLVLKEPVDLLGISSIDASHFARGVYLVLWQPNSGPTRRGRLLLIE